MRFALALSPPLILVSTTWLSAAEKKKPIPDPKALAAAELLVKDVFKQEYAKTGAADRLALAKVRLRGTYDGEGLFEDEHLSLLESD